MRTDRIDISGHAIRYNGNYLYYTYDPYNPLNLPAYTARWQFNNASSYNPNTSGDTWKSGSTWTQVSADPNVWDYHHESTDWSYAFADKTLWGNSSYTFMPKLLGMNTTGVTNFDYMMKAIKFAEPFPVFDISGTASISGLFAWCVFLGARDDHIPMFDTSHITDMSNVFNQASFGSVEFHPNGYTLPSWDTSSVTNMDYMLYKTNVTGYKAAVRIPSAWDTSNVTSMSHMFEDTYFYDIANLNTHNVANFSYMFTRSTNMDSNGYDIAIVDTTSAENVLRMYQNNMYVQNNILEMYQQMAANTNIYNHQECFMNCGSYSTSGQAALAQIPTSWGGMMS